MKTALLVAATVIGWAAYAHASEAYSDPQEYRTPGIVLPTTGVQLTMADTDPYELRVPGVTFPSSGMKLRMVDTDPFQLRVPGLVTGGMAPLTPAASQAAK